MDWEEGNEDAYWETGQRPRGTGQGARNDIHTLWERVVAGSSESAIALDPSTGPSYIKYHRGVARTATLFRAERRKTALRAGGTGPAPTIFVFWGPTGTGKSRRAYQEAAEAEKDLICVEFGNGGNANWFPAAVEEDENAWILLDDFYGGMAWHALLRLLDRYATTVQFKGGSATIRPERIYITSNKNPLSWYADEPGREKSALLRRIRQGGGGIFYLGGDGHVVQQHISEDFSLVTETETGSTVLGG